jgi:hypothetical protein
MRVASLIILVLAVSYSYQAQGVCVFDLDGTLTGVKNTSLTTQAVKACEDAGYKLAVNTAETNGLCALARVIQKGYRSGVSYGENVPKKMWMCRGWHLTSKGSKIANMKTAMAYYKTTKQCMVLFDDKAENVKAVTSAGFQGIQVNINGQGISFGEKRAGLAKLKGCNGRAKNRLRFLRTQKK